MAQSFNTNLKKVAAKYLRLLKINVTESSLKNALEQHPNYPSLLSLSETFTEFNIDNSAFRFKAGDLFEIDAPFIAYMGNQNNGRDFVLVTDIKEEIVTYVSDRSRPISVSRQDFLKDYMNIVWIAEKTEKSGEPNYESNQKKDKIQHQRVIALRSGFGLLLLLSIYNSLPPQRGASLTSFLLIIILKLAGLSLGILLVSYDIDKSNSFVKKICTFGQKTNCDAVLNSKASKVFGIGWGEIGFFYFASSVIWLLLAPDFSVKTFGIGIGSLVAAPYIFFSIYYQWRVLKQWCLLCLGTQVILAAEVIWSVTNYWLHPYYSGIELSTIAAATFSILLPIVCWYSIKSVIQKSRDGRLYEAAYKRLQYTPEIFNSLLQLQQEAPDGYQHLGINLGKPDARNIIIKVCNPYCSPCADAHPVLEELLHAKDVQVRIVFMASNGEKDRRRIPAKHLLSIASQGDDNRTKQALDDWYVNNKRDYDIFAAKYPINEELKNHESHIDAMKKWCEDAEIMQTPTIFVNGRRLPENYGIDELKMIL